MPYGWQFPDEKVFVPVEKGYKINIWGLISRNNQTHWATTEQNIDAAFVFAQLEDLSFRLQKPTVVVLDNASMHTAQLMKRRFAFEMQQMGFKRVL